MVKGADLKFAKILKLRFQACMERISYMLQFLSHHKRSKCRYETGIDKMYSLWSELYDHISTTNLNLRCLV